MYWPPINALMEKFRTTGRRMVLPVIFLAMALLIYIWDFSRFVIPLKLTLSFYGYLIPMVAVALALLAWIYAEDSKLPPEMSPIRNCIRMVLGSLWIIDGILQAQPQISFGFSHFVILPAISQLPPAMYHALVPATAFWSSSELILDSIAAVIQLMVGAMLITSRSRRFTGAASIVSVVWAAIIWVLAEGMGGMLHSGASILSGFPGAALIYIVLSILLFSGMGDRMILRLTGASMAAVFIVSGILQLVPAEGFWQMGALSSIPVGNAVNQQPVLLIHMLLGISSSFASSVFVWNAAISGLAISMGMLWAIRPRIAAIVSLPFSLFVWMVGEDFGIFGMYGTDPNTGLPLILVSAAVILVTGAGRYRAKSSGDSALEAVSTSRY